MKQFIYFNTVYYREICAMNESFRYLFIVYNTTEYLKKEKKIPSLQQRIKK
jgi:hypothetical protein